MTDNPFTKFIIHGPIEELPYVVDLLNEAIPMFRRRGERLGWGWHFNAKGKPTYFVREIKGGLSATRQEPSPALARTPSPIDPLNVEEGL